METESASVSARTPFAPAASKPKLSRRWLAAPLVSGLAIVASVSGLAGFISSDFVQGTKGGPIRQYSWWNLIGICSWMLAAPLAVGFSVKSTLLAYKLPETSRCARAFVSVILFALGVLAALLGTFWLHASDLLACGYIWCYDAPPSNVDPNGFFASVGSMVFFCGLFVAVAALALVCRTMLEPPDSAGAPTAEQMVKHMRRAEFVTSMKQNLASMALLFGLPAMLLLTGLLPNTWERFSLNLGPMQAVHSLKFFMNATGGINGVMKSEKPDAWMVTQNWRWTTDIVIKFFPDTVLYYGFLEGIVLVAFLQARCKCARDALTRKLAGFPVGCILLFAWFCLFLALFIFYWAHDHLFHGDGKFDDKGVEIPARVAGVVAVMIMGLLLLPASKSSPILIAAGISWESAVWVHIILGVLFMVSAACHVILYFIRFVQLGHGLDVLPLNAMFWYPQNPIGGTTPSDNWTVPMMSTVFWPSVVIFGVFPWMRRKNYELFRYSHNFFMVLIPAALWHATHAWYFALPGISLWMLDRVLRFLSATERVAIQGLLPHSVDCWTDPRPGSPSRNVPEKITRVAFTWPGQKRVHSPGMYVLVNFPDISVGEWHPFSLSSSPLDTTATLHIKHMGQNSFTGKLHSLANESPNQSDIVMNVQGPYGPKVDLHSVPHLVLVAGGIGVTPFVNTLRFARQSVATGRESSLRRLHLVWSARSAEIFDIFQDELKIDSEALPFDLSISLYCSTARESQGCALGTITPNMPNFQDILRDQAAHGVCLVRACGPPPMVDACAKAARELGGAIEFEAWSFVL